MSNTDHGIHWQPLDFSEQEQAWLNQQRAMEQQFLSAFHIESPVLGDVVERTDPDDYHNLLIAFVFSLHRPVKDIT